MEQSIEELANYIVNEIEREDFIYELKRYGYYKIRTTAKELRKWWEIDEWSTTLKRFNTYR